MHRLAVGAQPEPLRVALAQAHLVEQLVGALRFVFQVLERQWLDSGGSEGIEPPADVKRAFEAAMAWMVEPQGSDRYHQLANEMIRLNVDNLRFFGTVSSPPLVRIVNNRIGNMRGEPGWVIGMRRLHPYLSETWYIKQ